MNFPAVPCQRKDKMRQIAAKKLNISFIDSLKRTKERTLTDNNAEGGIIFAGLKLKSLKYRLHFLA